MIRTILSIAAAAALIPAAARAGLSDAPAVGRDPDHDRQRWQLPAEVRLVVTLELRDDELASLAPEDSGGLEIVPMCVTHSWRLQAASDGTDQRRPSSVVPPMVHAPMARPAQQLDIRPALVAEPRIRAMVDRHRPATMQPNATAAALAATIARQPPPPTPDRL